MDHQLLRRFCVLRMQLTHTIIVTCSTIQKVSPEWAICMFPHRQLLLGLAEWLCQHKATDERARRIVNGMHLFLLPTMNPDGFERHQRGNIHQVLFSPVQTCVLVTQIL